MCRMALQGATSYVVQQEDSKNLELVLYAVDEATNIAVLKTPEQNTEWPAPAFPASHVPDQDPLYDPSAMIHPIQSDGQTPWAVI